MNTVKKRVMKPLAQMPDTLDTSTPATAVQPVVEASGPLLQPTEKQEQAQKQHSRDKSIETTFLPESEMKDKLAGLSLDRMSLTSLKWMRKAESLIVRGQTPEQLEDIVREVAIYLLAHDTRRTLHERSRIFYGSKQDLEAELDVVTYELPIQSSKSILMEIAKRLAEETSTLVVVVPDKNSDSGAAVEGNS